jgi:hypothetical protein
MNGYFNERYMLHFDFHFGSHVRTFVELATIETRTACDLAQNFGVHLRDSVRVSAPKVSDFLLPVPPYGEGLVDPQLNKIDA